MVGWDHRFLFCQVPLWVTRARPSTAGKEKTGTCRQQALPDQKRSYNTALQFDAVIEEPAVIERILTHLGLSAQPTPDAPARRFDLSQAA
jgi:hypothetical protein